MSDAKDWVKIQRDFDAPIEKVWQMWTDPTLFQQWYGPSGFDVPVVDMALEVGGTRKICMEMKSPERNMTMWFTGVFKAIEAPKRLVYTESMCDADGNVMSAEQMGMPAGQPTETEVQVSLTEVDGKTRMVMIHAGVPAGSPGEGGWQQAFDTLALRLVS